MSDLESRLFEPEGPALPAHLYVHVPFCASKCAYCDFFSLIPEDEDLVRIVFRGIDSEVMQWSGASFPGVLDTVYFGGGTPSLVAERVASTLDFVREHLPIRTGAEITVEANPDSVSAELLASLVSSGVTRLSLGVQSFDDAVLRFLGRRHDAIGAWRAARMIERSGLLFAIDLMCGVPGQTAASWASTLDRAVQSGARHLSVYPLSVEEGTPLGVAVSTGLAEEPDPDVAADMMLQAEATLAEAGFERYEVANYAMSAGDRSAHNSAYWTGSPYIGVGPGAHGMLDGPTARAIGMAPTESSAERVRYGQACDLDEWLLGRGTEIEELTRAEARREDVMLGLRLTRGVTDELAESAGVTAVLEALGDEGLLARDAGRWRTTHKGWLLGNEVFSRVWNADTP